MVHSQKNPSPIKRTGFFYELACIINKGLYVKAEEVVPPAIFFSDYAPSRDLTLLQTWASDSGV